MTHYQQNDLLALDLFRTISYVIVGVSVGFLPTS